MKRKVMARHLSLSTVLAAALIMAMVRPDVSLAQWVVNGVPIRTAPMWQGDQQLVSDGAGGAIIAWYDYRSGNYDVYAQKVDDKGNAPPVDSLIRSDANVDTTISMTDAIFTLKYLYIPGSQRPSCMDAADADDSGVIDMSDAIYTLQYLYVPGASEPPPPFPGCGPDPTEDNLVCRSCPPCGTGVVTVKKKVGSVK